jgi:hypothetical protein
MNDQLIQLRELETQLHEANQECARASRPLDRLSELNGAQREQVGAQLRSAWARWEAVTRQISQVLKSDGPRVS